MISVSCGPGVRAAALAGRVARGGQRGGPPLTPARGKRKCVEGRLFVRHTRVGGGELTPLTSPDTAEL